MDTDTSSKRLHKLWDIAEQRGDVWWRHDVDYDVSCALKMAKAEQERGIVATYFFLTDSYGLDGKELDEIQGRGHEIAPHVDLRGTRDSQYSDVDLFDACQDAHDRLCRLSRPVDYAVSFHQPPKAVIGRDIPGFESAQGSRWQGRQTADSRGVFRLAPEELMMQGGPVQINLHPEWWFWPKSRQQVWRKLEATKP